jgi:uncharacterized membrane protein (GlpM family)
MYLILKAVVTAIIVIAIAECGKKFSLIGGVLASLPLTSILAFIWLYQDTRDISKVIELSHMIFWMVIPSLLFFLCLPYFLKQGVKFYPALLSSAVIMFAFYTAYIYILGKLGVKL